MSAEIDEFEVGSEIRVGERSGALEAEAFGIFEDKRSQHPVGYFGTRLGRIGVWMQ
ncbi:MAG TPA: hypothetical protein VGW57_15305 [Chthoniobacterales bacterium]|nr:hypothetical protein [Chthoniobacterales bacterium]